MTQVLKAALPRFPHLNELIGKSFDLPDATLAFQESSSSSDRFDVSIWPITKYLAARELGLDAIGIPVFPVRRFVQWMVEVPEGSHIREARDLAGKRIGQIDWGHTCAVNARGVLADGYQVDLSDVSWFTTHKEQVEGQRAPEGVTCLDRGLDDLLLAGQIDVALGNGYGNEPSPGIRRLWTDPEHEAAVSYQNGAFFPIVHLVVLFPNAMSHGAGSRGDRDNS